MEKISIKTKELRKAAITMESKMASKTMVMMMAKLSHLKDDLMQVEDWAFTFFLFFGLRKNATIGDYDAKIGKFQKPVVETTLEAVFDLLSLDLPHFLS